MNKQTTFSIIVILLCTFLNLNAQKVYTKGRKLIVNGKEYKIKGICYSRGGAGNYEEDIKLLTKANINTIRTYQAIDDLNELDAFARAGIKIIMHLHEDDFEEYIVKYKGHPAILMWAFGNEFNYHPEWFGNDVYNWYTKLEACAIKAKQLDPNHPVSSAHGEVPTAEVLELCPSVDIWGLNLYRWDNNIPAILELAERSNKGIYVSEAGADSYNKILGKEDEEGQAKATQTILESILNEDKLCMGVTLFEFCDEWWKAGQPEIQNVGGSAPNSSGVPYDGSADEEYWGIVKRDRSKKKVFFTVKEVYSRF